VPATLLAEAIVTSSVSRKGSVFRVSNETENSY
jgi:hypothetical protein